MKGLLKNTETSRVSNAVAAGTTTVNSSGVNMSNAETVLFIVAFGTITAGAATSIKLQQSSDDGSSDAYDDLTGTSITVLDTDDNLLVMAEITNPVKKWVRCVVLRATQNSVIDSIIAIKSGLRHKPAVQPATVQQSYEVAAGPDEGTA